MIPKTAADLRAVLAQRTPVRLAEGRKAAVLVPVLFGPAGPELLFMKRPDGAQPHAGQVSFPGGKTEPTDRDPVATALREAEEELGIAPTSVEVLGALDDINTAVSAFDVTPVVGALHERPVLRPSAFEVADTFWLPLEALADQRAWRSMRVHRNGRDYEVWFFNNAPHVVWGATAAMTRQLLEWLEER